MQLTNKHSMFSKIITHIQAFIDNHQDGIVTVGSGLTFSIGYWMHTEPMLIVGKLIMTFMIGLFGGIGGYAAKIICNRISKKFK